jgi:hypothetical protein
VSPTEFGPVGNPNPGANGEGIGAPPPAPKLSRADEKRQRIFQDRMKRLMTRGMTAQQAYVAIQKEDYDRLPVSEKLKRLEMMVSGALQQFAGDIQNLQHNDRTIADSLDANFRAITKVFTKLNVSPEDQTALLKEAVEEIKAERKEREAAQAAAQKRAQEAAEKKAVTEEIGKAGEPAPPPEGATTFGG